MNKARCLQRLILVGFLLIAVRVWHLAVVQRADRLQEADRPKIRKIVVRANRGVIFDRFGTPLAINRISYNAAIYYGQIAQIPVVEWKSDPEGKRVKTFPRKEHIRKLSAVLEQTLDLDAERIEDLIHSKASLLPHVPYVLKNRLSEEEYSRLKMLEKDWLGLHAEIASERYYPWGKAGCHLIGTLGAISSKEYEAIVEEIGKLQQAMEDYTLGFESSPPEGYCSFEEVAQRLYELRERAYTLNDQVGKSGIEGALEEKLRGYWGLKTFEVDPKGRSLRELSGGKEPIGGQAITLSISIELQRLAEELLCLSEQEREGKSLGIDPADQQRKVQKQPWIKGGSIVVLDPNTGEILAMASHPRFDPNDFVQGNQEKILSALESETDRAALWDGKKELERERPRVTKGTREIVIEKTPFSWDFFLNQILPGEGPLRAVMRRVEALRSAIQLQEDFEALLYFSQAADSQSLMESLAAKSSLFEALKSHPEASLPLHRIEEIFGCLLSSADRLFAIDLCCLIVESSRFSTELMERVGAMKLSTYHSLNQSFQRFSEKVYQKTFAEFPFRTWREENQKVFLAEKRREEKEQKKYARPYLDYLDQKRKELFREFWEENRIAILLQNIAESQGDADGEKLKNILTSLPQELQGEWLKAFRAFCELEDSQRRLVLQAFPSEGFGFARSYAFQSAAPQGSLFKLVTAYEALCQGHSLTLIDELSRDPDSGGQIVAYSLKQVPYPRLYKGGRLPRSSSSAIGTVDLVGALEHSSNPYFSILAGDYFKSPEDLKTAAQLFGLGEKTGLDLAGEVSGNLPSDLATNRTGLYAYAIGQHTLLTTPIQSALMLGALANGGSLLRPKLVREIRGQNSSPWPFTTQEDRIAGRELDALGISFPLFTENSSRTVQKEEISSRVEVRRSLPFPTRVRDPILEGMDRSLWSGQGNARPTAIRSLLAHPQMMQDYILLKHQMVGKTSTAEILWNPYAYPSSRAQMYKHISFGAISFCEEAFAAKGERGVWESPELVVLVFLRYGDAGKEGAPIAAELIRAWRKIYPFRSKTGRASLQSQ